MTQDPWTVRDIAVCICVAVIVLFSTNPAFDWWIGHLLGWWA